MTIYLATDHAGFKLKEKIKERLIRLDFAVKDFGAYKFDAKDDYPDFVKKAAKAVSLKPKDRAIILGGSGQGEAIVANRYRKVRAAVFYGGPERIIKLSREHNNANILSLGASFLSEKQAIEAVKIWLKTPFPGAKRHKRRLKKIV